MESLAFGFKVIGKVSQAMTDLGCHFPDLKVFKTKVSHERGLACHGVIDKPGLAFFPERVAVVSGGISC